MLHARAMANEAAHLFDLLHDPAFILLLPDRLLSGLIDVSQEPILVPLMSQTIVVMSSRLLANIVKVRMDDDSYANIFWNLLEHHPE